MYYVYLLESESEQGRNYVGSTRDLKARLATHNRGGNISTKPFRPWKLTAYVALRDERRALAFEEYLKSGSGRTFAKRHLL